MIDTGFQAMDARLGGGRTLGSDGGASRRHVSIECEKVETKLLTE